MSRRISNQAIIQGIWAPLELLPKAKGDENEPRLRVRDLTRPGPMAWRIFMRRSGLLCSQVQLKEAISPHLGLSFDKRDM